MTDAGMNNAMHRMGCRQSVDSLACSNLHKGGTGGAGVSAAARCIFPCLCYNKQGSIREFTNNYIREKMQSMNPDEAWETIKPLMRVEQSVITVTVCNER